MLFYPPEGIINGLDLSRFTLAKMLLDIINVIWMDQLLKTNVGEAFLNRVAEDIGKFWVDVYENVILDKINADEGLFGKTTEFLFTLAQ